MSPATTERAHKRPHSPRHLARAFALLGLYQWLADPQLRFIDVRDRLTGLIQDEDEALEGTSIDLKDFEKADQALFSDLLSGVLEDPTVIEPVFAKFVDRDLKRVSLVERAILFLGTYELMKCPQTPYRVVLNEAVELAKEFGSGYRFTNAVLEHVAEAERPAEFAADHAKKDAKKDEASDASK